MKPDPLLSISAAASAKHPGVCAGLLVVGGLENPATHPALEAMLVEAEQVIRQRYGESSREAIRSAGHLAHYQSYYRTFGQNYHVVFQIESIALKGKAIPRRAALVEIPFRRELLNGLLTAVHDADPVQLPLTLDVGDGERCYAKYDGESMVVKPGDLYFHDQREVLSSIVLGPAQYGWVTEDTRSLVVTIHGVPGVGELAVRKHLEEIWGDLQEVCPGAALKALVTAAG